MTASSSTPPVMHELLAGAEAEQAEPVVDRAITSAPRIALLIVPAAAEQRRAADDRRGDRVQEDRAAARVRVDRAQPRGEDDAADRRHREQIAKTAIRIAIDVDARAAGRLGVAADREDLAAEAGALEDERPEQQQGGDEQEHVRQPAVLVDDVDDAPSTSASAAIRSAASRVRLAAVLPAPHADLVELRRRVDRDAHEHEQPGGASVRNSLARPMVKSSCRITVPREPMSSSTTPFHASRPASVTTNDGIPIRVMMSPCSVPIAAPRRARDEEADRRGSSLPSGVSRIAVEHTGDTRDVADREVDLAEQEDADDAHGDVANGRGLDDEVDEVARRSGSGRLDLEDDRDEDQADDDRQRAEVALRTSVHQRRAYSPSPRWADGASGAGGGTVAVLMPVPPGTARGPWRVRRR